ncbi:MAG: zinc metalloprotease HtpX [Gemmatimonadota bacterium]|jgi:heat shock protein HtpX
MQILKIAGLMTGLTILMVGLGAYFGGQTGAVLMFVVAAVMNFGSFWFSDRAVLRMYRARIVDRTEAPELYAMVERLARRAGLPMPTVAVAPQQQPNAFATGRSPEKGVVCFTEGILRALSGEELEGVTAHELAHIKHRHMLVSTFAATMAGAITMLAMVARWGAIFGGFGGRDGDRNPVALLVTAIVAPLAAMVIQFAISRQNEFQADRTGAEIAGRPDGLADALQRLDAYADRVPMRVNPAGAQLAIVNPLKGRRGIGIRLLSTHPPMEERIARLREMGRRGG